VEVRAGMTRRAWALFAAMCVIWGVPYLLIRVAVRDVPPGTLVFARTAIGGLILVPFALRTGGYRVVLKHWRALAVFTAVEVGGPWLLLSEAERVLSSSLTGLLVAAVPLVGVVAARVAGVDSGGGAARYAGLLLGIIGVARLLGLDIGAVRAGALVEMVFVVLGYAIAPVIMSRHLSHLPNIPVISASLLLAAAAYLPYAATHRPASISAESGWSVLGLGVICTALAFVVFFSLIGEVGPARATVFTYVNPAVAVLLGVLLLGEPFTLGIAVGFPLILVGSVLAARLGKRPGGADAAVPEAIAAETVCGPDDDQSMRTSPRGVSNTAATSPLSSSASVDQDTCTPSSGSRAAETPR
jgi:drug/metabolite transporter (DMT)-like permease